MTECCASVKMKGRLEKQYQRTMNKKTYSNCGDKYNMCYSRHVSADDEVRVWEELKAGKAPGTSDVYQELIGNSGEEGIQVMAKMCQEKIYTLGNPC